MKGDFSDSGSSIALSSYLQHPVALFHMSYKCSGIVRIKLPIMPTIRPVNCKASGNYRACIQAMIVTSIVYELLKALVGPIGAPVDRAAIKNMLPSTLHRDANVPYSHRFRSNSFSLSPVK